MSAQTASAMGLDGVVVADTLLSQVDGWNGRLVLRGLDLERAAAGLTFEGMAAHLWGDAAGDLQRRLGAARVAVFEEIPDLGGALAVADGRIQLV